MSSAEIFPERQFEHAGQTYIMTPPNLGTEALYTRFLEGRHVKKVQDQRDAYGPDYRDMLAATARDAAVGMWEWGSQGWVESLGSDVCFEELAFLTMLQKTSGIDRKVFHQMWVANVEKNEKGQRVNRVAEALIEMINRPNSSQPATKQPAETATVVPAPAAA